MVIGPGLLSRQVIRAWGGVIQFAGAAGLADCASVRQIGR